MARGQSADWVEAVAAVHLTVPDEAFAEGAETHTDRSQSFVSLWEEHPEAVMELLPVEMEAIGSAAMLAGGPASMPASAFASRDFDGSPLELDHTRDNGRPYTDGNDSTRNAN